MPLYPIPLHSIPLHSIPLHPIPLHPMPLHPILIQPIRPSLSASQPIYRSHTSHSILTPHLDGGIYWSGGSTPSEQRAGPQQANGLERERLGRPPPAAHLEQLSGRAQVKDSSQPHKETTHSNDELAQMASSLKFLNPRPRTLSPDQELAVRAAVSRALETLSPEIIDDLIA